MASNIDDELGIAVCERDLQKVRALLFSGANPNFNPSYKDKLPHQYGYQLLHYAPDEDIVKELLLNGAYVNSTDTNNRTPLHTAIAEGRTVKVIRELLKHGADVNYRDRRGNTPLNLAVKKSYIDLEVIRELLECGADINIRNRERRAFDNHSSPFDNAIVNSTERVKLLIKIALIKNFDKDYRKIVNLDPYRESRIYNALSSYLSNCISEIIKMKTDYISDNLSLYQFISKEAKKGGLYACVSVINRVIEVLADTRYPIYRDFIVANCKFERGSLLSKLSEIEVYTKSDVSNHSENVHEKKVVLDTYSKYEVAKYLSNTELFELIATFYKFRVESQCLKRNSSESGLNEAATSNYARLE